MPRLDWKDKSVKINIFPQDPETTPDTVPIIVRGGLLSGPVGNRIAVYDYNRDRDEVFNQAAPNPDGSFPDYDPADFRFHQLASYGIVARAIELAELELGRDLIWPFGASRLIVLPHAGFLANAFYSEQTHSLQFYTFLPENAKAPYHTCLSHDIVAHEAGHAILDTVRTGLTEGLDLETAALHEALGDLTTTFAVLSHQVVRNRVMNVLNRPNLVTEIAEDFDGPDRPIRSLLGAPSDWQGILEPHRLSLKISRSIYAALVNLFDGIKEKGTDPASALQLAHRALQRVVVRGLDYLPPADATFADYGRAILAADAFANPADVMGFRAIIEASFINHGILDKHDTDLGLAAPRRWRAIPSTWPQLSLREAYLFLDKNRDRLALSSNAAFRDFIVSDCFQTRRPGTEEIDQTIIIYRYPVDVRLTGSAFVDAEGHWLTIIGGGTLVFDHNAQLRFHAEKPVTAKRVDRILKFLGAELHNNRVGIVGDRLGDEIRLSLAQQPRLLTLRKGQATLRTNAAARCCIGRPSRGAYP